MYIATAVFLLQAGFIGGVLLERNLAGSGGTGDDNLSLLSTLFQVVQDEYYYRPGPATPEAEFERSLQHAAATGMLQTLDGYSQFLPPAEASQAAAELAGAYEGIGIYAVFEEGQLTVTSPMMGSPAEAAGIQPGDVIVAADERSLAGLPEAEALGLLRGEAGTTVVLTIQRAGAPTLLQIEVQRQPITVPVVTYHLLPETRVAHISISVFGDTTLTQLEQALKRAAREDARGIVLDLRGNGGGWVEAAQGVIGRFIPAERGPALYEDQTVGPGGEQSHPILEGEQTAFDVPLVVLVDEGTASAAEIVAGALQDYERGMVVGQTTFGKGSVQRVYEFEDGSSARVTIAEWLTPDQKRIEGAGIEPDVVVDDAGAADNVADPELERAQVLISAPGGQAAPATPAATPVAVQG
ncbi:MAG: S41 family peptidase [Chloroflexota bacterium]|nr:S41 family peptidase [Chloroflexota bacterium]